MGTLHIVGLICSMRAVWSPPFICVSALQLWHHQGTSSEAKNKVRRGTTSAWRCTRGLPNIPNIRVCVRAMFLQWPLSSNVLMLNLTDSGTTAGPVHAHIQNPKKLTLLSFGGNTHTHVHTQRFQKPSLKIATPDVQSDLLWTMQPKPHPASHAAYLAYTVCNNICNGMWCESTGREELCEQHLHCAKTDFFIFFFWVDFCDSLRSSPPCADLKFQPCSQTTDYPTHSHITSFVWCVKCRRCSWVIPWWSANNQHTSIQMPLFSQSLPFPSLIMSNCPMDRIYLHQSCR